MSQALKFAQVGGVATTYVDDVFSTYLYTGNGSTQTITNGIDLAGKGGLVWTKCRGSTYNHRLYDTERGATIGLRTNTTDANHTAAASLTSFNSNGFSLGSYAESNDVFAYASWTFRNAAKFFTHTTISHTNGVATNIDLTALGTVGQVIAKITNTTGDWIVWHRSLTASNNLRLNTTAAQTTTDAWLSVSGTTATLSASAPTGTYVVYGFAHDTGTDGIIQCGSFTTDGSGNATVNLGWEIQYATLKVSSTTGNWITVDSMRGIPVGSNDAQLYPNLSNEETAGATLSPTAVGFDATGLAASQTYIYLTIRRPNKPPTSGTQVYNAGARTGTGAAATTTAASFPVDLVFTKKRSSTTLTGARFIDRLRGKTNWLDSSATTAETSTADTVTGLDVMTGFALGADATTSAFNTNTHTYVDEYFRRAPGVFDVVCYTGNYNGSSGTQNLNHNLVSAPELIIVKDRSAARSWFVYHKDFASANDYITMNVTSPVDTSGTNVWNNTRPTTSVFSVGTVYLTNGTGETFVAYLFATKPGISKVGSYTGNGSTQTINCGFSAGARFVLIKRTDSTGDWYVWDSVRGIVSGSDPHLSLNTTAAEVTTDDSIDPDNSGFIVNQDAATNINVNTASYIYLAFA